MKSKRKAGAIFGEATFAEAFPTIATLTVEVTESGEGNHGLGIRRFNQRSAREWVNCSSENCLGKGFSLGALLRRLVAEGQITVQREQSCESLEESGRPCANRFS